MQQSTACLHFAWRTKSQRVGGRAARLNCLPALRRGGGWQAGATVLSCVAVWIGSARQVRSASEYVRRSHCAAQHTPTQTSHRTHLSGGRADWIHTATPDTTRRSCLCRVWCAGVNWTIALNMFTDFKFSVNDTLELSGIQLTSP